MKATENRETSQELAALDELLGGALAGRLSRREMLRRATALGLSAPVVAAMLSVAPGVAAQGTPVAAPSGDPVVLGGAYNLTGGLSSLENPARDGSELALDEVNAAGGVLGRPLQLDVEDGKSEPTAVTNAAKKLIEENKVVALIGITDTSMALPVAGAAQDASIPFLTVGATAPVIADTGDYVFLLPFGDNVQAAASAEFAKQKGWTSCALLVDDQQDYTKFLAQYFKDAYTASEVGGTIVKELSYAAGDTDYSAQLTELKNLNPQPQVIFISSGPAEIGTIVKQARALGIQLPILGGDGYDTPDLITLAGDAANNVFFTTHEGIYGEESSAKAFNEAYQAKFGKAPQSVFAALGYDGVKLMVDAIARAGSTDGDKIRDALAATKGYKAVTGTISYDEGSRVPTKSVALIEVKGGVFTLLDTVTPQNVPAP